jgi:hypothetical protein
MWFCRIPIGHLVSVNRSSCSPPSPGFLCNGVVVRDPKQIGGSPVAQSWSIMVTLLRPEERSEAERGREVRPRAGEREAISKGNRLEVASCVPQPNKQGHQVLWHALRLYYIDKSPPKWQFPPQAFWLKNNPTWIILSSLIKVYVNILILRWLFPERIRLYFYRNRSHFLESAFPSHVDFSSCSSNYRSNLSTLASSYDANRRQLIK